MTHESGSPLTTDEDPQTRVAVPGSTPPSAEDTASDPALTDDHGADWAAEGGAAAEGPATDFDDEARPEEGR